MSSRWGRRSVSSTESFLSTYGISCSFLGLYIIANVHLFLRAAVEEGKRHADFQRYVTAIARGCGATINLNISVVLLLASRSLIGFLRETPLNMVLPIDKAMPDLHRIIGKLLVLAGVLHSTTHWVTYIIKKPWSGGYSGFTSLFISGMILLIAILAIRISARPTVYQSNYEAFIRVHIGGSVMAFVLVIIHGLHRGVPNTWKWVVGPIVLYSMDVAFRSFRVKRSYLLVSKHSAVFQGPDILKVRLPRVFHFQAGQYAELKVPELSLFQWHPFTIASAPHESEMVFYIKAVGDWTISLYQLFSERIASGGDDIEVHIRGPFGASSQHVGQFDRVILVGGGVGATPFCSVVKDAYNWMINWAPQSRKQQQRKHRGATGYLAQDFFWNLGLETRNRPSALRTGRQEHPQEQGHDSHLFTTNVCSEELNSAELNELDDVYRSRKSEQRRSAKVSTRVLRNVDRYRASRKMTPEGATQERQEVSRTTTNNRSRSMYTARDYLSRQESHTSVSTSTCSGESSSTTFNEQNDDDPFRWRHDRAVAGRQHRTVRSASNSTHVKASRQLTTQSSTRDDLGMGSYRENSSGTHRRSLDYMTALHSAYSHDHMDETYQRSLDMIVSRSFGSALLVRNVQMKKVQRTIQEVAAAGQLPVTVDREDLSVFHSPSLMFLLFMRSVTVNMVLLWALFLRFIIAGTAFVFNGVLAFDQGLALYKSPALIAVDLALAVIVTLLIGIPSVLEVLELGTAVVHGVDLFVLTPLALFSAVADVLALANIGQEVDLFGVVHIFVVWPLMAILVMIRLIRVIGERIAQAESLVQTHKNTKAVDFYWTAPTPEDDGWLVEELTPYSDEESVQLHRFLTRCNRNNAGNNVEQQSAQASTRRAPSMHTSFGRPDWNEIMNETAEQSRNNATIGVFFCGPHSMGAQVQEACMAAMRNSIVRGLHSGAVAMRGLEEIFGEAVSANEYTGETTEGKEAGVRGCNVKFVFKRESFA